MNHYHIYILTTKNNKTLYVGVTNNLLRRVREHKDKLVDGFTKKYNLNKLVYFEEFTNVVDAIAAEKKIKGWLRIRKTKLIESLNPTWEDLFHELLDNTFTSGTIRRSFTSFRMTKGGAA